MTSQQLLNETVLECSTLEKTFSILKMARTSTAKKRAADSDSEPETVSKRVKSGTSVESDGKDDDGNPFWEVREFKASTVGLTR